MPRRNPYNPGNSGQQIYTLDEAVGPAEAPLDRSEVGDGFSVIARRPRYGFPGDFMDLGAAAEYDAMVKPTLNYDEKE